jgi:hypothetical protein
LAACTGLSRFLRAFHHGNSERGVKPPQAAAAASPHNFIQKKTGKFHNCKFRRQIAACRQYSLRREKPLPSTLKVFSTITKAC